MATHPCKCGFFGNPKRECHSSSADVQRYRERICGPLLARIDIRAEVPAVKYQDLTGSENILGEHVGEAIQYRTLSRNPWT